MPARVLTTRELGRATLARQLLLERATRPVVNATSALGGLQAQEPGPPHIGLWSRLRDYEAGSLLAAYEARTVVRATMMRGTLHVIAARDFLALRSALDALISGAMAGYLRTRAQGVDLEALSEEAVEIFDSRHTLTAAELRDELAARHPGADVRALAALVRTGLPLVRIPDGGRWGFTPKAPFSDARHWLGRRPAKRADRARLLRTYLAAFGPATVRDAETWLGGEELAPVFERMRDGLERFEDERGRELFDLPGAPRPGPDAEAPVRLLPEFDSLVLAHADRTRVIADEHRRALTTKNLRVRATVLVDGTVAGFWKLAKARGTATVVVEPLTRIAALDRRAIEQEGERLALFAEPEARRHAVRIAR